jgi:hypothetical protein
MFSHLHPAFWLNFSRSDDSTTTLFPQAIHPGAMGDLTILFRLALWLDDEVT